MEPGLLKKFCLFRIVFILLFLGVHGLLCCCFILAAGVIGVCLWAGSFAALSVIL